MKDHFKVETPEGWSVSFMMPEGAKDFASIRFNSDANDTFLTFQLLTSDVVSLCLIHRALGHIIEAMQPGLALPLPEGDPNEFDAIKVQFEVDRKWREGNQ